MIPTPIQAAQSLLAIHHHHQDGSIYYKEAELIPLLSSWGIVPDWDGCAKAHQAFEKKLREDFLVTHPGETLKEILEAKGMTIEQLADKTKRTPSYIQSIIDGEWVITKSMAAELEMALDINRQFWINHQHNYNEKIAKAGEQYKTQGNES